MEADDFDDSRNPFNINLSVWSSSGNYPWHAFFGEYNQHLTYLKSFELEKNSLPLVWLKNVLSFSREGLALETWSRFGPNCSRCYTCSTMLYNVIQCYIMLYNVKYTFKKIQSDVIHVEQLQQMLYMFNKIQSSSVAWDDWNRNINIMLQCCYSYSCSQLWFIFWGF